MAISGRFERHLQQIEAAAKDISSMHFSPPGIFTNSQVTKPPITSLIRDTSPYERVLFSPPSSSTRGNFGPQTVASSSNKSALLGSLLDGNVIHQMRSAMSTAHLKGEVDVELLLHGAENLARIYLTPGLNERIQTLRERYKDLRSSVTLHEELVAAQRTQLDLQRRVTDQHHELNEDLSPHTQQPAVTPSSIQAEEIAIRQLEARRLEIESEIRELDRRLGGMLPPSSFQR
ncbi:hypothetical protein TWF696_007105 [Orbilia brochopaga]|uniref:DASH complex subunit SPC34 n=1 Tax=Orbilia brochopaga TaxID=3140254 RepID=A0AAV9UU69_9PEZI